MDPVTHTLVGVGIANAFFRKRIGKAAVPILAWASNLPDIDAVVGLTFLGALVHLFFDLVNSFGVVLLWPFSDWRPELGIFFIIDLILTGLLAAPLLLSQIPSMRESLVPLSRGAVALVAVYVLLCAAGRTQAQQLLEAEATQPADFSYVFPEPLGPHRWRGVWREGETYRIYLIHLFSGRKEERDQVITEVDDPRVEKARPLARRIEWFFKAPVWKVDPAAEGRPKNVPAEVQVYDLRFRTLVVERSVPFVFRFRVDEEARAVD